MKTEILFDYACPECEQGSVQARRILNYKTKIKGYPFVVNEALIGECDQCGARSFAHKKPNAGRHSSPDLLKPTRLFCPPRKLKNSANRSAYPWRISPD